MKLIAKAMITAALGVGILALPATAEAAVRKPTCGALTPVYKCFKAPCPRVPCVTRKTVKR